MPRVRQAKGLERPKYTFIKQQADPSFGFSAVYTMGTEVFVLGTPEFIGKLPVLNLKLARETMSEYSQAICSDPSQKL